MSLGIRFCGVETLGDSGVGAAQGRSRGGPWTIDVRRWRFVSLNPNPLSRPYPLINSGCRPLSLVSYILFSFCHLAPRIYPKHIKECLDIGHCIQMKHAVDEAIYMFPRDRLLLRTHCRIQQYRSPFHINPRVRNVSVAFRSLENRLARRGIFMLARNGRLGKHSPLMPCWPLSFHVRCWSPHSLVEGMSRSLRCSAGQLAGEGDPVLGTACSLAREPQFRSI